MARSFYPEDRDQTQLFPQTLSDWLPPDQLCHVVIDLVEDLDLRSLYALYKDGKGQKAYHPRVMLALLFFAYCLGERSSRRIEWLCTVDIRYRIIACHGAPDHSSIARFRQKFLTQIDEYFLQILRTCKEAGMSQFATVALDGTKIEANAAMEASLRRDRLADEVSKMLHEAQQTDEQEDAQAQRSPSNDETLPQELRDPASRKAALRAARARLDRQKRLEKAHAKADQKARQKIAEYDEKMARRDEKQQASGCEPAGHVPKLPQAEDLNDKANTTDPDSEIMKGRHGYLQGYNAQAVVDVESQLIIAARVVSDKNDMHQLRPMLALAQQNLEQAGIEDRIKRALNDGGYWAPQEILRLEEELKQLAPEHRPEIYVAVPRRWQQLGEAPQDDHPPPEVTDVLRIWEHRQRCPSGQQIYKKRAQSVEPVFGQIKSARDCKRFMVRGEEKVDPEWVLISATHNILKLWRYKTARQN